MSLINPVPRLRSNIIANFVGRASNIAFSIIFTPFYIHFLGIEAYGLIGFYSTLQASIGFLEMGLSRTCNREIARYSGLGAKGAQRVLDLLRSLEVIYWIVALLLGVALSLSAPWISSRWLDSRVFSHETLSRVLILVAWLIALRWPLSLYTGALMGMQQHVWLNVVQFGLSMLNWGGAVLVLWLIEPDIQLFFKYQLLVALFSVVIFVILSWMVMPGSFFRGIFSLSLVKSVFPYAAAVAGNGILGAILTQADKLILSAMLTLKQFGAYMLASVFANGIVLLANPVADAVFPKFSQLLAEDKKGMIVSHLYHLSTQFVSVVIIPVALMLAFYSRDVLYVYTGKHDVAVQASTILSVLVVSKMLHATMLVPYALQLAHGWVRLSLYVNIASVCWLIPGVFVLINFYGPLGAAIAWLVVTLGYVAVGLPLMHRKLLKGEFRHWLTKAFIVPLGSVGGYLLLVHTVSPFFPKDRLGLCLSLVGIGLGAFVLCAMVVESTRVMCLDIFLRRRV